MGKPNEMLSRIECKANRAFFLMEHWNAEGNNGRAGGYYVAWCRLKDAYDAEAEKLKPLDWREEEPCCFCLGRAFHHPDCTDATA